MSNNNFPHTMRINWIDGFHTTIWWNETCAMVLETFGLPGHRYIYHPFFDYMEFQFKSEKDYLLAQVLLSERI
ncbi:hypothetical protein EB118_24085 [bacterium]|nr:hypothetical protein [bacterium]